MALKELGNGDYQIPENHFRDVVETNPWRHCIFSKDIGVALTIDDAVKLAKGRGGSRLPSAQEFAAYVLSGGEVHPSKEYWLRTAVYVSHYTQDIRLALCDDADEQHCVVSSHAKDLGVGQLRAYLSVPRGARSMVEHARMRSSLEGRTLDHPECSDLYVDLNGEKDVLLLNETEQWRALFGVLGKGFAKRFYRHRMKKQRSTRVTFEYPDISVMRRDRFSNPEGMRALRVSNLESDYFRVTFGGSFREEAAVLGVRNPEDFYGLRKE